MTDYTVILSDTRTDLPVALHEKTPRIWGYEVAR